MNQTHYFVAVPLEDQVRTTLQQLVDEMKSDYPFKKWVHPLDFHITLAFLGNSSAEQLKRVKEKLKPIIKKHESFTLELSKIGTFGNREAPRILWCGVFESEPLKALQRSVYHTCEEIGYSLDKKAFKPHITIARKWIGDHFFNEQQLQDRVDEKKQGLNSGEISWNVKEVVLYETHMKNTPKYKVKEKFLL